MGRNTCALLVAILICATGVVGRAAPPGFADIPVGAGWNQAVGICFAPAGGSASGRMFVWEKSGKVWNVINGIKLSAPLIDLSQEVGNWGDFGMVGVTVDPSFSTNGYIYLLYVVDYHHARYFGTGQYNPTANEYNHDTIGRLTRYTANASDGFLSVDNSSRVVLLGESLTTGIPVCHLSHGVGALVFGEDGTLLASCGDGASFETADTGGPIASSSNTALADGIITTKEDVGAFRAQLVDSLSGKILRLDPATGDGVPSNPFYDAGAPRSARSRVWAMGLRNPYRMCIQPGTGAPDPSLGRPGAIFLGDVGWFTWEEFDTCTAGGQNFGWPLFEGLTPMPLYEVAGTMNQDAPNPLNGTGACTLPYFRFQDLCIQDTTAPSFPNPCDAAEEVPAGIPHFVHTRPALDWKHTTGPARTGIYSGTSAAEVELGAPGSPVAGASFSGNCATGGVWYTSTAYPAEYQNTYFMADFGEGWIRCLVFDASDRLVGVQPFIDGGSGMVVCVAADPVSGDLHYLRFSTTGNSEVRRVVFFGDNNHPPTAVATATPTMGEAPLTVQFDGTASTDFENLPMTYDWDFGDGSPHSDLPSPVHVYTTEDDVTNLGTVVAKIFAFNPPNPLGNGNPDPDVMRDGDRPPVGSTDFLRQYDTSHNGDQGTNDWIGYTFAEPHQFVSVVYQEGARDNVGGWWSGISVQYFNGTTWEHVPGISSDPPFVTGKAGPGFRTYRFTFTPTVATGLRLYGNIFVAKFVSVGELRVFTSDPATAAPRCRTARLTVTDAMGAQSAADVVISLNNTAPEVTITSPVDGTKYSLWRAYTVPLTATISDAEHGPEGLSCEWQTIVHHTNHTHPEPPDPRCAAEALVVTHGDDCLEYFYEFRLTVADAACLSTTRSVFMYPNCCRPDFNNDGFVDGIDYDQFNNAFEGGDPAADYNADQFVDGIDYDLFNIDFEIGCP